MEVERVGKREQQKRGGGGVQYGRCAFCHSGECFRDVPVHLPRPHGRNLQPGDSSLLLPLLTLQRVAHNRAEVDKVLHVSHTHIQLTGLLRNENTPRERRSTITAQLHCLLSGPQINAKFN